MREAGRLLEFCIYLLKNIIIKIINSWNIVYIYLNLDIKIIVRYCYKVPIEIIIIKIKNKY